MNEPDSPAYIPGPPHGPAYAPPPHSIVPDEHIRAIQIEAAKYWKRLMPDVPPSCESKEPPCCH